MNYIIKFTGATTGGNSIMYDTGSRIGVGTTSPTYLFQANGDIYANGGWMRVSGNQGLYFESWGGGWYMTDSTWLRSYNGKAIYTTSDIRADGIVYWGNGLVRTETLDDAGLQGSAGARSGFFETSAPAPAADWYPNASSWQHLLSVRHSNNGNNYAFQIGGSFFDQDLWYRKTNNSATTTWLQLIGAGPRTCTAPFNGLGATVSATVNGVTRSNTICATPWIAPQTFNNAQNICAAIGGHIATYNEVYRLAQANGGVSAVGLNNDWIGNRAGDDQAYCINSTDINNFEGNCNKSNTEWFRCVQSSGYNE